MRRRRRPRDSIGARSRALCKRMCGSAGPARRVAHRPVPPPETPAGRHAAASRGTIHETHCRRPQVGPLLILTHDFIPKTQHPGSTNPRVSASARDLSSAGSRRTEELSMRRRLMTKLHHPVRKYRLPRLRAAHTIGAASRCTAPGAPTAVQQRPHDRRRRHASRPAAPAGRDQAREAVPRCPPGDPSPFVAKKQSGDSAQHPPCIQMPAPTRPVRPARRPRSRPFTARCRPAICG